MLDALKRLTLGIIICRLIVITDIGLNSNEQHF